MEKHLHIALKRYEKIWSCLLLVAVTLLLSTFPSSYAQAHSPYFTQKENMILSDGRPIELRLLHGDGIFSIDPTRIVAVDQSQHLLALSQRNSGISLNCGPLKNSCWGYDHRKNKIFILDPASFRRDAHFVPIEGQSSDLLWPIMASKESWGFTARKASVVEFLIAETMLSFEFPKTSIFFLIIGFLQGIILTNDLSNKTPLKLKFIFFNTAKTIPIICFLCFSLGFVNWLTGYCYYGGLLNFFVGALITGIVAWKAKSNSTC